MLSTPLTVCLVVLGRHLPQFEMFDILFGDEPVLHPHVRLYQRLLAGDATEASFAAEEALEETALADWVQGTALPALMKAQDDRDRGVLTLDQEARLAATAHEMLGNLAPLAAEQALAAETGAAEAGAGLRVVCLGGRWGADDVSAALLAQVLAQTGAEVRAQVAADMAPARLASLRPDQADCLVLCFLDPSPSRASLLHVRRIKRLAPQLRVGVAIWQVPQPLRETAGATDLPPPSGRETLAGIEAMGADFVVTRVDQAVEAVLSRAEPRRVEPPPMRLAQGSARKAKSG